VIPSVGRIVHYTLSSGKVRPAIIVELWIVDQSNPEWKGKVNLQVFTDGGNDVGALGTESHAGIVWRGSVEHHEDGRVNSWRWPPKV